MTRALMRPRSLRRHCLSTLFLITAAAGFARPGQGQYANGGEYRKWTDNTGKYSVVAKLVTHDHEHVLLKKNNGATIRVPLRRLSDMDRQAVLATTKFAPAELKPNTAGSIPDLTAMAVASLKEPRGMIVFGDLQRQEPVFVTLKLQGKGLADVAEYGMVKIDRIVDDKGKTLRLLKPIESERFHHALEGEFVELDHFFLDEPNTLAIPMILEKPSEGATTLSLTGSLQVKTYPSILVADVLLQVGRPLATPGLNKLGRFTVTKPGPADADDPDKALVIDFAGDLEKVADMSVVRGDGSTISDGQMSNWSDRQARVILFCSEDIPQDAMLRIVPAADPQVHSLSLRLNDIPIRAEADDAWHLHGQ